MDPTLKEKFDMARDAIKHEDMLTNYRTTWMLVFQGFLFSAYATAGGWARIQPRCQCATPDHLTGVAVICVLGVLSAIASVKGILAADKQLIATRKWLELQLEQSTTAGKAADAFPPQYAHPKNSKYYALPLMFILLAAAWIVLCVLTVF